jgi:hypothetical protein
MPGTATRIAVRVAVGGTPYCPADGTGYPTTICGSPAEIPAGGSLETGVGSGGTTTGEGRVLGGEGGDGSGAGAWALGEGTVVLGSLAVPTRGT